MTRKYPIAKAKCCGDYIDSRYRHDFVSCKCGKAFLDGGGEEYIRCGGDLEFVTSEESGKPSFAIVQSKLDKRWERRLFHYKMENWRAAKTLYSKHGIITNAYLAGRPSRIKKTK